MSPRYEAQLDEFAVLCVACINFFQRWLCWRKWLRANGTLAWSISNITIRGETVGPSTASSVDGETYFDGAIDMFNVSLSKSYARPSGARSIVARRLYEREQLFREIERKWCSINSREISECKAYARLRDAMKAERYWTREKTLEKLRTISRDSRRGALIVTDELVENFCACVCHRLLVSFNEEDREIARARAGGESAANCPIDVLTAGAFDRCSEARLLRDASWRIDSVLRTFNDSTIIGYCELTESRISRREELGQILISETEDDASYDDESKRRSIRDRGKVGAGKRSASRGEWLVRVEILGERFFESRLAFPPRFLVLFVRRNAKSPTCSGLVIERYRVEQGEDSGDATSLEEWIEEEEEEEEDKVGELEVNGVDGLTEGKRTSRRKVTMYENRRARVNLSTLKEMLNPFDRTHNFLVLGEDGVALKNVTYSKVLTQLFDENQRNSISRFFDCPSLLTEIMNLSRLKTVSRYVVVKYDRCYDGFVGEDDGADTGVAGDCRDVTTYGRSREGTRFFSRNGLEVVSPMTLAIMLLSEDTRLDVNAFQTASLNLEDGKSMEEAIDDVYDLVAKRVEGRMREGRGGILGSLFSLFDRERLAARRRRNVELFEGYATSVLFSVRVLARLRWIREKLLWTSYENGRGRKEIDIERRLLDGFYMSHERYDNLKIIFVPSTAVPRYERALNAGRGGGSLEDEMREEEDGVEERNSRLEDTRLRLVLLRRSDPRRYGVLNETSDYKTTRIEDNSDSNTDSSAAEVGEKKDEDRGEIAWLNLGDPIVLCGILKDIVATLDPSNEFSNQLFNIDTFGSRFIAEEDELVVKLGDAKEEKKKEDERIYGRDKKLWQILRDPNLDGEFFGPERCVLLRYHRSYYSPELVDSGIAQNDRGIVPLELTDTDDTWKLYAYENERTNDTWNAEKLMSYVRTVGSVDRGNGIFLFRKIPAANDANATEREKREDELARLNVPREPMVVKLLSWYEDHYDPRVVNVKKIVSKRIYLLNDLLVFLEDPVKIVGSRTRKLEKANVIRDWNFANFHVMKAYAEKYESERGSLLSDVEKLKDDLTRADEKGASYETGGSEGRRCDLRSATLRATHFERVIYDAMKRNKNFRKNGRTVDLRFHETPYFYVMYFQCTNFWFPKWSIALTQEKSNAVSICYDDVPKHIVPLIQWSLETVTREDA